MRIVGDRILVQPILPARMHGSLHLPETVMDEPAVSGRVVALGSGPVTAKGIPLDHTVKVGDVVFFSPIVGQETTMFGEPMIIMREEDVLAVQEE